MARPTPLERFEAKFVVDAESGCWNWTAGTTRGGYGKFKVDGRTLVAHRWYYQQTVASVADHMQLDHLCRNTGCVNPAHLDVVTCRENLLRGETFQAANASKTHCPAGHPLSGDNLLVSSGRCCRTCKRASTAAWRAANLDAVRRRDRDAARRRRARLRSRPA